MKRRQISLTLDDRTWNEFVKLARNDKRSVASQVAWMITNHVEAYDSLREKK